LARANNLVVRYLPAAEADLADIYRWILSDAPGRAEAFLERIDRSIGGLSAHPKLGRIPRHSWLQGSGYRVLTVDSYLVFYVLRPRVVEIHRIVHGSRSLDELV
jgi:plasmid stabilization system protein ParE